MALPILDGNQSATTLSTILTGGAHIPAHTVVSLGSQAISDITSAVSGISVSIGGTQTTTFGAVTGSVSVLNFPSTQTIAGTVTANVSALSIDTGYAGSAIFGVSGQDVNAVRTVLYSASINTFNDDAGAPVDSSNPLPISGTVTANGGDFASKNTTHPASAIQLGFKNIGGDFTAVNQDGASFPIRLNELEANIVVPISGTVTVGAMPNGALTTRFGSVTTANTAQITSAVTNTNRKYLLAQNISAGTVTIGIGFSPTTTQGIQLTAGGGLTFDSFCPTGAVYWLGAVTGAAFTILEG